MTEMLVMPALEEAGFLFGGNTIYSLAKNDKYIL